MKMNLKAQKRKNEIERIRGELQCIESCLGRGFTLEMYANCQKQLFEILQALNKDNEDE